MEDIDHSRDLEAQYWEQYSGKSDHYHYQLGRKRQRLYNYFPVTKLVQAAAVGLVAAVVGPVNEEKKSEELVVEAVSSKTKAFSIYQGIPFVQVWSKGRGRTRGVRRVASVSTGNVLRSGRKRRRGYRRRNYVR